MPAAYTPSQKASIAQFVGFTQAKDSAAAKVGALHRLTGLLSRCTLDRYPGWAYASEHPPSVLAGATG